jgi:rhizosphere induced protein
MRPILPPLPAWGPASVPVGAICAYAGQLTPERDSQNQLWGGMPCAGGGGPAGAPAGEEPVVLIEAQGWMVCDGRALEPARHPALYAVLGTLYGGDGAGRFHIPDCRGLFLRGVDSGAGLDPGAGSRTGPTGSGTDPGVGSLQCDAVQDHVHAYTGPPPSPTAQGGTQVNSPSLPAATGGPAQPGSVSPVQPQGAPIRVSPETRPRNIAVHWLIKFR